MYSIIAFAVCQMQSPDGSSKTGIFNKDIPMVREARFLSQGRWATEFVQHVDDWDDSEFDLAPPPRGTPRKRERSQNHAPGHRADRRHLAGGDWMNSPESPRNALSPNARQPPPCE